MHYSFCCRLASLLLIFTVSFRFNLLSAMIIKKFVSKEPTINEPGSFTIIPDKYVQVRIIKFKINKIQVDFNLSFVKYVNRKNPAKNGIIT